MQKPKNDTLGQELAESASLQDDFRNFQKEKDAIRQLVGQIGGVRSARRDRIITITFTAAILFLFCLDVLRHFLNIPIPLPALFSVEIGILLVSLKIIWMIHKQARVEHFQFWILHSIEFRLNDLSKKISEMRDGNR